MKFSTAIISALAATLTVATAFDTTLFARDLANLDAEDAYSLGFLHARSVYDSSPSDDDLFELYARTGSMADKRPNHPTLPAGSIQYANDHWKGQRGGGPLAGTLPRPVNHDRAGPNIDPNHRPYRPEPPNRPTEFFDGRDVRAVRQKRSVDMWDDIYGY